MKSCRILIFIVTILCFGQMTIVGQDLLPTLRKAEKATTDKDIETAKTLYRQMIANPGTKMDTTMAYAFSNMAHFFFMDSNRDSMIYFYNEGHNYYNEHGDIYRQRYFLNAIASAYRMWGNEELSLQYFLKTINIKGAADSELISARGQLAAHLIRIGNLDSAEVILLRNLKLCDSIKYISSNTWAKLAKIETRRGNFPRAISHYSKSIETYQTEFSLDKSPLFISNSYISISRLFMNLNNYEKAHEMLNKAQRIADDNNFKRSKHRLHRERGTLFLATNVDSAIYYLTQYEKGLNEKSSVVNKHSLHVYLAQAYIKKSQMNRAKHHFDQATELYPDLKKDDQKLLYQKVSGLYYTKTNNPSKALQHFQIAYDFAKSTEKESAQIDLLGKLEKVHAKMGNIKEAYALKDEYQNRKEALTNLQSQQIIYELEGKFQKVQQELEISTLTNSNREKDIAIESKNRLLWSGLLGLLGVSLLGWQSYRLYRNKKKSNVILEEKNSIISKSLSEKELLLKEIHHRVKNNLQVVSSLLSLQSEYVKDDSALNAINEGRNRVKSMALIHQNLYQEENLTGIKVKEYFSKLIQGLFNSYNISQDRIQLNLDIEDMLIDVDTIVPLGLISNELISNALKYAFPKNQNGRINVSLHRVNSQLQLSVLDNGVGFDTSLINENISSFGYQMIQAFCDKLGATLDINSENGTQIKVMIKDD